MQNLRKIKKLNDNQKVKELAMSEMIMKKSKIQQSKNEKSLNSFIRKSIKNQDQAVFTIKNLDSNKIQFIDHQTKVTKILQDIDELPQLQRILQKIWSTYLTQMQKQQEQFLQACYQGNIQRVKKVINGNNKHPIDPKTAVSAQGKNGIHLATVSGSYKRSQIIQQLVSIGADVNGRTYLQKRTPLMLGSVLGNEIAVKALLQSKADIALADYQGNTALHLAIIYNHLNISQILLQFKAPIDIKNKKNISPLDFASQKRDFCQILRKYSQSFVETQSNKKNQGRLDMISKMLDNLKSKESKESKQESQMDTQTSLVKKQSMLSPSRQQKIKNVQIRQIGLGNFKKISLLGKGAFGEVFLVQNTINGKRYAMKSLDKSMIMQQNILRYAMTQRKILSTINHPFVVRLHYAFQTSNKLFLVMDYCPGGDMLKIIKQKGTFQEPILKKYVCQIILAIEALHKAQIIYRDLKPGNVILDEDGHALLTDFGLSKEASLSHSFCGSTAYLAPQMLWRRGHTKVLDWYLLGVLIYECLTGKPPFWDSNKQQLFANIKSGRYKHLDNQYSKQVRDLTQQLLKSNSNKRLGSEGADQIKKHPWFGDINWKKVQKRELVMPKIQQTKGKAVKSQIFDQHFQNQSNKINGWDYVPEN